MQDRANPCLFPGPNMDATSAAPQALLPVFIFHRSGEEHCNFSVRARISSLSSQLFFPSWSIPQSVFHRSCPMVGPPFKACFWCCSLKTSFSPVQAPSVSCIRSTTGCCQISWFSPFHSYPSSTHKPALTRSLRSVYAQTVCSLYGSKKKTNVCFAVRLCFFGLISILAKILTISAVLKCGSYFLTALEVAAH